MDTNKNNSKVCKKCKEEIHKDAQKCSKCGANQSISALKKGIIIVVIVLIIGVLFGNEMTDNDGSSTNNNQSSTNNNQSSTNNNQSSTNNNQSTTNNNTTNNTTNQNNANSQNKNTYSFNETFKFDDLEITIGSYYSFDIVQNTFSEYHNQTVVKLPITVKNISGETHGLNMFYYNVYGSRGTETKTLSSYFDENIDYAGDLRTGATYTKFMYFLYDGDGEYAIEFNNYSEEKIVEFNIIK